MKCVCSECGHEQDGMGRCEQCSSIRVILQSVAEEICGPNWRKAFLPKGHPDALQQKDMPPGVTLSE